MFKYLTYEAFQAHAGIILFIDFDGFVSFLTTFFVAQVFILAAYFSRYCLMTVKK
jgi:hypothetical protein